MARPYRKSLNGNEKMMHFYLQDTLRRNLTKCLIFKDYSYSVLLIKFVCANKGHTMRIIMSIFNIKCFRNNIFENIINCVCSNLFRIFS